LDVLEFLPISFDNVSNLKSLLTMAHMLFSFFSSFAFHSNILVRRLKGTANCWYWPARLGFIHNFSN